MSESRYYKIELDGVPFVEQTGSRMLRAAFDADIRPGELALCEIRLFNYSQDSLQRIKRGSNISLSVGYSESFDGWASYNLKRVGQIFTGTVANFATGRDGAEIVTTLFCTTMARRERRCVNIQAGKNATIVDVLQSVAREMPRRLSIDPELFKDAPLFTTGYSNNDEPVLVLDALAYMFDFDWSDDNGRLVIVKRGKGKPERVTNEINPLNGMIGSPEIAGGTGVAGVGVIVNMRLDPFVNNDQWWHVTSNYKGFSTGSMYFVENDLSKVDGDYQVIRYRHRGDTHTDQWLTEFEGVSGTVTEAVAVSGLSWGGKVTVKFRAKVREIAGKLGVNPDWLMNVMALETGETFRANISNKTSGATGLIQFMPATARGLGTTTTQLARMSEVEQLEWVMKYYSQPHLRGKVRNQGDAYFAVLWPKAMGKPGSYVLWEKGSIEYNQNSGLDVNRDGKITRDDVMAKLDGFVKRGLQNAL